MFLSGHDDGAEIYIMDMQTKRVRRITDNKFQDANAAWSPDGSAITFASTRDGNFEVYMMQLQ